MSLPEPFGIQFWSYGGITDEVRARLEKILAGPPVTSSPIRQTKEGIWIIDGDSHISKWVEERGTLAHDHQTLPIVLREIPVGGVVVDIGANIGDTTAPFLERVGPEGTVYAFEPHPAAFECLLRNCPKAIRFQTALGDTVGTSGVTSLENAGANYLQGEGEVPVTTLDKMVADGWFVLDRCDLIKIDVEGFENRVLKGAEQTITRFRPKMLIEVNDGALARQGVKKADIYDWLRKHDYEWMPVQELMIADAPQYDILCKWKGGDASCPDHSKATNQWNQTGSNAVPTVQPTGAAITPWQSKEESLAEINRLAARLKEFCTAPRLTKIVRDQLRAAKVIK